MGTTPNGEQADDEPQAPSPTSDPPADLDDLDLPVSAEPDEGEPPEQPAGE